MIGRYYAALHSHHKRQLEPVESNAAAHITQNAGKAPPASAIKQLARLTYLAPNITSIF
jgi:hypothetical protein